MTFKDGYDPNYDVKHTTPAQRDAYRERIKEMIERDGISVRPWLMTVGHGYHPETGEDQVTISSHDEKSRNMLTQVMPLWMARQVRDNLVEMIGRVERLTAAGQKGELNDDSTCT